MRLRSEQSLLVPPAGPDGPRPPAWPDADDEACACEGGAPLAGFAAADAAQVDPAPTPNAESDAGLPESGTSATADPVPGDEPAHCPTAAAFSIAELSQRCAELEVRLDVAEAERRHARSVLAAMPDPVIVTNPFEDVVLISAAAARLFGTEADETAFVPLVRLWPDEGFTRTVAEVRSLHCRGARRKVRRTFRTATGQDRTYDVTLICACDQNDGAPSPWGVIILMHEVPPAALDRERTVAEANARVTAAVAEELHAPLAALRAYTDLLRDGATLSDRSRQDTLALVASEADRLFRLIDDMHLLARIEAGQFVPRDTRFDAKVVLGSAYEAVLPRATARGVRVVPPDVCSDLAACRGDRDLLRQALLIVLTHAVRLTPPGGTVRTTLTIDPASSNFADPSSDGACEIVEIVISDTGVGIPPKDLPYVFDKYTGRTPAGDCGPPGRGVALGVGLPLVRSIVETVLRGAVFIESRANEGTRVQIRIPVAGPQAPSPTPRSQS